ncbi:MAG: hypothetical protein EB168_03065, partial [Euryarchaeota archaeon]|nr:hypothetical protein [Euryarchaeota archaeon]
MDATWREHLSQDGPGRMRIKRHGRMLADAVLISEPEMLREGVDDRSPQQLVNTAELPGIVGDAWAMADWHFGYGFPIGGVVATSVEHGEAGGAISPGGVGFDINCGVRLLSTGLAADSIDVRGIVDSLQRSVPAGATSKGGVQLTTSELDGILAGGARAASEMGLGADTDLERIESGGFMETTERDLSERALARGGKSLGTLGSGNHFLELQVVDRVLDEYAAKEFGI